MTNTNLITFKNFFLNNPHEIYQICYSFKLEYDGKDNYAHIKVITHEFIKQGIDNKSIIYIKTDNGVVTTQEFDISTKDKEKKFMRWISKFTKEILLIYGYSTKLTTIKFYQDNMVRLLYPYTDIVDALPMDDKDTFIYALLYNIILNQPPYHGVINLTDHFLDHFRKCFTFISQFFYFNDTETDYTCTVNDIIFQCQQENRCFFELIKKRNLIHA